MHAWKHQVPLDEVREMLMGDQDSRDSERLPFEQHPDAIPIREEARCYGLALTIEQQRKSGAPVAASKVPPSKEMNEHLTIRKDLITVRGSIPV